MMSPVFIAEENTRWLGGAEPNIASGPDGTLWAGNLNSLWKSSDDGATWQAVGGARQGGGDGDYAVGGDGTVHWLGLGGSVGEIPYQRSTDAGQSWSSAVELSASSSADREWIDATRDGWVYASWRDVGGNRLVTRTSMDGGVTWMDRVVVGGDAVAGPVTHDPGDCRRVYLPFVSSGLKVAVSADGGVTWGVRAVTSVAGALASNSIAIFPVAAVDDAGIVYLVWSESAYPIAAPREVADPAVFLSVSKDGGSTWSAKRQLSSTGKAAVFPWVAAGAPGRIAVVWYENTVGLPNEFLPDVWNVRLAQSVNADASSPAFTTVNANDFPIHVGSICTAGLLCLAGRDRGLLDFFEVTIPPNGLPKLVWAADDPTSSTIGVAVYAGGVASGTSLR